ncbi:hypothetical protein Tco_1042511 [Tanacetum coccineum]|uniref:Reverse transcriptase Ty1/copia-type domain-containing protein n=1 Tax=Tanacetum coccineum TaxID=301880 RepID=A0ABQ5GJM9_9ASTR
MKLSPSKTSPLVDDDLDEEEAIKVTEKKNLENDIVDETLEIDEIVNIKESRNHPLENVIGNLNQRTLRSQAQNQSNFFCFISTIEPKNVNEALGDESWIVAMQEELNQFVANDVWELVPQPRNMTIIGTKWVFRNKLDENGIVSRNKASVCLCARFQEAPKTSHLEAVKRIFRYIKGTTHLGLWYPKGTGIETVVYVDYDHAGDYVDKKSTSGYLNMSCPSLQLAFDRYLSHDRAMHPLAPHYERNTRADHGKKRPREQNASSSSSTLNHPSFSSFG